MTPFKINDRVWYIDNGPWDTGTVIDVSTDQPDANQRARAGWDWDAVGYNVKWDAPGPDQIDWYTVDQLGKVE